MVGLELEERDCVTVEDIDSLTEPSIDREPVEVTDWLLEALIVLECVGEIGSVLVRRVVTERVGAAVDVLEGARVKLPVEDVLMERVVEAQTVGDGLIRVVAE